MAGKPTMFCLVIVCFVVGVTQAQKRIYPLGINLHFTCESLPESNLSCPGDIKVLAGSGATLKMTMNSINKSLEGLKNFANESCIKAVIKSSCLGFPRCERERQYVDIPAAISACEAARNVCPKLINDNFLICEENKARYQDASFNAPKCKNIKDSTGTCPDIKYKYVDYPSLNITESFLELKQGLQTLKPNITSECYEKFRSTACLFVATFCSPDETTAVSYISKQECEKKLKCLPDQSYSNGTKYHASDEMCGRLPDESKGIDLRSGASLLSQTGTFIFTAIILFNSFQLF